MIGSIVGASLGAAGSIYGGIKMSSALKKVKNNIKEQMEDNQNWYDRRYNEDATQRADAQALLTRTEESIKNRNRQAAGAQAVAGGTEESVAATKAANNKALTDTVTNIDAAAASRKDNIEQQYRSTKSNLNQQLNDLTTQGATNTAQAVQGVAQAGSNIASLF